MTRFPVTKSFLATDALARQLEAEYGLADVRCQLITATLRDVYLVTLPRQRFVLYVYRQGHRTLEQIEAEWRLVAYLATHGVSVAPAVPRMHGDLVMSFDAPERTRYGVLTTFVAGRHLRQRPSVPAVRNYGHHVATIHEIAGTMPGPADRPAIDVATLIDQAVAAAETALIDRPDAVAYLRACAPEIRTRLHAKLLDLPKEPPAYGTIHGDVTRANALVRDDDKVTVLDFDFFGMGWRAYDIASYLLTIRGTDDEDRFADAFVAGYTDVRTLLPTERQVIPLFEAVRAVFEIGTPAKYVDHWGSAYLYAFLDQSLERLRQGMYRLT